MRLCPYCKEEIHEEAIKCKHCGSMIGTSSENDELPSELNKWNWAAFLWGPFWAIGHKVWIGLLAFIPYVGIIMSFVLGAKGNQWAWEKNNYNSLETFKLKQKKWVKAWFYLFGFFVLLGLLTTLVGPRVFKDARISKQKTAEMQISMFENSIAQFKLDVGRFPTTHEGLNALFNNPGLSKWDGPYLTQEVPRDPWDREYIYFSPGSNGREYEIMSYGLDGYPGGDGENKDIVSWTSLE